METKLEEEEDHENIFFMFSKQVKFIASVKLAQIKQLQSQMLLQKCVKIDC